MSDTLATHDPKKPLQAAWETLQERHRSLTGSDWQERPPDLSTLSDLEACADEYLWAIRRAKRSLERTQEGN
ncbi:MAG TPA: hypothetical protein VEW94_05030 [Chloroflexia bacterium]|nr:hypothetical protein [Chloroflexia bacterium]